MTHYIRREFSSIDELVFLEEIEQPLNGRQLRTEIAIIEAFKDEFGIQPKILRMPHFKSDTKGL